MSRRDLPAWLAMHTRDALTAISDMPSAIAQRQGFYGSDLVMDKGALMCATRLEDVVARIRRDVSRARADDEAKKNESSTKQGGFLPDAKKRNLKGYQENDASS